jgi:hypothetical protein
MLDLWEDTDDLHDVAPGAISAAAFFSDAGDLRQTARITDIVHTVVAGNDNEENRAARSAVLAETSASVRDWSRPSPASPRRAMAMIALGFLSSGR